MRGTFSGLMRSHKLGSLGLTNSGHYEQLDTALQHAETHLNSAALDVVAGDCGLARFHLHEGLKDFYTARAHLYSLVDTDGDNVQVNAAKWIAQREKAVMQPMEARFKKLSARLKNACAA